MEQKFDNNDAYIEHGHPEHHHRSDRKSRNGNSGTKVWLAIGVVVLIILLIIWLTIADLWGDTDVAAQLVNVAAVPAHAIMQCLL